MLSSMFDLNTSSATDIAAKIKAREISVYDVVTHFISQQKKLNPKLNALVENHWEEAEEEALQKDEELKTLKNIPPLFGLPITVKEMFAIEGFKSTLGSIHRKDSVQKLTSTVVQRLRDAGAIVVGTTNVPELGFWYECENPVYGWTRNPFDFNRTSGGSSGGEASIVGSGASLLGVGSDVGGSIRLPASFCGIFGHKPSNRIVPLTGHYPLVFENCDHLKDPKYPLTVAGPMTRSAKDLRLMLEIMLGPDSIDPCTRADFKLKAPIKDWSNSTVWILPSPSMMAVSRCSEEVSEAVEITGQYFESIGARVKRMKADTFKDAFLLWSTAMSEVDSDSSFEENLFNKQRLSVLNELFRNLTSKTQYTIPALGTVILERLQKSYARQLEPSQKVSTRRLAEMREKMKQLLGEENLLVMPAYPRTAPLHRGTYLRPFDFSYSGLLNALLLPASSAPVMMGAQKLPIGVQLIAGPGQDHVCLSAAEVVESAFGGWKPPAR